MSGPPAIAVPPQLVDKLAKVAALLASDHAGERAAAAWQASRLLHQHQVSWRQLVEAAAGPRTSEPPPDPTERSWRTQVETCLAARWRMTGWERDFLATIAGYDHRPTDKQLALLAKLHTKATAL